MLAVMSIMTIIMLVAVFNFVGLGSSEKVRSSVIQLKGNIVTARQNAITKRTRTALVYSNDYNSMPARGLYWLMASNVAGAAETMIGDTNFLSPGLLFSNAPARITFRMDGSLAIGASSHNIVMAEQLKIDSGGEGLSARIRIYGLTGLSKIIE